MRIALATPLYPPEGGGPATFAKALEDELPKHGWSVITVKFSDVRHLPKLVRHIAYAWRVLRATRKSDLVLALDPVSTGLPALLAVRLARKPFYVRIAGDYAWEQGTQRWHVMQTLDEFVQRRDYPFPVRMLKWVQLRVAKAARRIIVPSAYLKSVVSAWGMTAEKISVAYNAAPFVDGAGKTAPLDEPYLVSVGRLVPWKGMHALIRTVAELPHTKLVIVGGGPERERLEKLARNLDVAERVIFTDNLPHDETLSYLAGAGAFILNTRYEGLSHLVLEALALGVPVLTTPVGGNPELITDHETGLLFAPDDTNAMKACIDNIGRDAKLRKHITTNGKVLAATFTMDRMITDVITALS